MTVQKPRGADAVNVLFLCTGNYYRSRFAEELFNHLAIEAGIAARADSRGFTPHPDTNPGSISRFALAGLAERSITPRHSDRMPRAVRADDFTRYSRVIAMSDVEHRPMMSRLFPALAGLVRFWTAEDLKWESPVTALNTIERQVRLLLLEISSRPEVAAPSRCAAASVAGTRVVTAGNCSPGT